MKHIVKPLARGIAVSLMLVAMAACTRTEVKQGQANTSGRLARPDVVMISDYTFNPSLVKLDAGVAQRVVRAVGSETDAQKQAAIVKRVADAVSEDLVKEVRKLGFTAARTSSGTAVTGGTQFFITGQFMTIDEGNETRRNIIGLGAGASEVKADTQFLYRTPDGTTQRLQTFVADAQSGRKPGAAETLGAGAALGMVAASDVASEKLGADVKSLGEKMAGEIAKQLAELFKQQGWVLK